ncbi:extracellular solute-binding protein [Cohnella sp.]|uniref:extracellular solute-binding protein n=1 Tax=Cohnella sp. TaxID=1883426 RepID=UPI0035691F31
MAKKGSNKWALLLTAAMLASVVSGCSGKQEEARQSEPSIASGEAAKPVAGEDGPLGKYDPPIELSAMKNLYGDERFLPGEDIGNNVWTRAYLEELGIKLHYDWAVAGDGFQQKVTMTIASNDLPDLMTLPAKDYFALAKAGKLADLTPYFDKYASDTLKSTLNADGGMQLKTAYVEGKLYGIPQTGGSDGTADMIWIRADWLKKLGLSEPRTLDDVIRIARAFRNDDPDGDGVKNTFGIGFQKDLESGTGSFEGFLAAYHAYAKAWVKGEDGKIAYGAVRPGMKEALAKLREMFKEDLIDVEFGVKDWKKVGEDIASGKIGLLYGREGLPWGTLKDSIVNNPDAEWISVPIVSADARPAKPATHVTLERYFAISANVHHPEALLKIINLFQEKINNKSTTLETLNKFGVDPDSGINFAAYAFGGLDPSVDKPNMYYQQIKSVIEGAEKRENIHPEAIRYYDTIKHFIDNGRDKKSDPLGWNYYKFLGPEGSWKVIDHYRSNDLMEHSAWYGLPTATMSRKGATLDKLQAENFVKIITGSAPVSDFDKFVADWHKLGGDQITAEVNEWYTETFGQ